MAPGSEGGKKSAGSGPRPRTNLSAIGAAAVLAVYSAGFAKTKAAADRFVAEDTRRAAATSPDSRDANNLEDVSRRITTPVADTVAAASKTPTRELAGSASAQHADAQKPKSAPRVENPAARVAENSAATDAAAGTAPVAPVQTAPVPQPIPMVVDEPAPDTAPTPKAAARYKDGVYLGWGSSRHGDIQASVEIRNGLIVSATIAQCRTQYSCSRIDALPPQVVARQSAEVDYVSRATQSSNAFYYAVANALAQAK